MNYNITIGLISVVFIVSCSQNQPVLDTNKKLSYQFGKPKRQLLTKNQANSLGNPTLKELDNNRQNYYSANGNICRKLSTQHTACYINNNWYESKPIMSSNR
jgi:hypothetical protein